MTPEFADEASLEKILKELLEGKEIIFAVSPYVEEAVVIDLRENSPFEGPIKLVRLLKEQTELLYFPNGEFNIKLWYQVSSDILKTLKAKKSATFFRSIGLLLCEDIWSYFEGVVGQRVDTAILREELEGLAREERKAFVAEMVRGERCFSLWQRPSQDLS